MITTALIYMGVIIVSTIVGLLPTGTGFPSNVSTAINYFAGYVGIVDPLLPLDTLHTIVLLTIGLELAIFGFKMLRWLYKFTPFIGK